MTNTVAKTRVTYSISGSKLRLVKLYLDILLDFRIKMGALQNFLTSIQSDGDQNFFGFYYHVILYQVKQDQFSSPSVHFKTFSQWRISKIS